jgi:hypothetical protein
MSHDRTCQLQMHFIGNEMETPLFVKMHFSFVLQFQFMLQTVNPIDAFKVLSTTTTVTTTTTSTTTSNVMKMKF